MEFINFLHGIHPMAPELTNYLSTILKPVTLKKNEYLLNVGDVCGNIYFVEKGLLRSFKVKDGKEVTNWFMREKHLVAVKSFLDQIPSKESIQALEACTLQCIAYNEWQAIFKRFLEFNIHGRICLEENLKLSADRSVMFSNPEPLERYLFLLNNDQELIKRVENKHIASYLNVSVKALSQLKKMAKLALTGHIKLS